MPLQTAAPRIEKSDQKNKKEKRNPSAHVCMKQSDASDSCCENDGYIFKNFMPK